MKKVNLALVGYGTVGAGVVKYLKTKKTYFKEKFNLEYHIRVLCDRSVHKKDTRQLKGTKLTSNIEGVLDDDTVDVVLELIGGMKPAKDLVIRSLKKGKHVVTANKELIANSGQELFKLAQKHNCQLCFESSVGAGIPIIKTITEGIAGNHFNGIFGIINGTCNFILSEMSKKNCRFEEALAEAQKKGYAESDPTLDINGTDSVHKLAILIHLAFGKHINIKDIYREGITHISHDDIEHAESLNLTIKLLAIAKKTEDAIEARVHPTLIAKDHPLASINDIYNAIYLDSDPLGDILLSGEGAGQMAAASGVISDLINLASTETNKSYLSNVPQQAENLNIRKIDQIETKFYLRFIAPDKPGTLSKITGILGRAEIGINSVTQKAHNKSSTVPVIMLTDYTTERALRAALNKIHKTGIVKSKPVAIRMEKLK